MTAEQIIDGIGADVSKERRLGFFPVLIRLGDNVRAILKTAKAGSATWYEIDPLGASVLGIPLSAEPAIDPNGYTIEYEPQDLTGTKV